ncbi:MAG: hypothetical protein AAFU64_04855, partial [Bacteroidota bacterium]
QFGLRHFHFKNQVVQIVIINQPYVEGFIHYGIYLLVMSALWEANMNPKEEENIGIPFLEAPS